MAQDERGMQRQGEGTERVKGWEMKRKPSVKDGSMMERTAKLLERGQTFLRRLGSALTAHCDPWTLFMCRCISECLRLCVCGCGCVYICRSLSPLCPC